MYVGVEVDGSSGVVYKSGEYVFFLEWICVICYQDQNFGVLIENEVMVVVVLSGVVGLV